MEISNTHRRPRTMRMNALSFTTAILLLPFITAKGGADLNDLMKEMEHNLMELADAVEHLYLDRNCTAALAECSYSNYNWYSSQFTNPTCYDNKEFVNNCTGPCSGELFDYQNSNVVLTCGRDETDLRLTESVCYTRFLDEYFRTKFPKLSTNCSQFGVESPAMFFGSQEGVFRIYPGRHFPEEWACQFDVRRRPWYLAATTSYNQKNILLVMDISTDIHLVLLKETAKDVLLSLTESDYVALVLFNDTAKVIGDKNQRMIKATEDNKKMLSTIIDDLVADGQKNIYDAFNTTFNTLEDSIKYGNTNRCNNAIILLSGALTKGTEDFGYSEQNVTDMIRDRLNTTTLPFLFIYTIGGGGKDVSEVYKFHQKLACRKTGFWSSIVQSDRILDRLSSYYRIFAYGGESMARWMQPYSFASAEINGTTVFAAVFDRSKLPFRFLGAVGINLSVEAMTTIAPISWESVLTARVESSSPICFPLVGDTFSGRCGFQSFRTATIGNESIYPCMTECTPEESECPAAADYPQDVWDNTNFARDMSYEDRVCCEVKTCRASSVSDVPEMMIGIILIGTVMAFSLLMFIRLACSAIRKDIDESGTPAYNSMQEQPDVELVCFDDEPPDVPNPSPTHDNVQNPQACARREYSPEPDNSRREYQVEKTFNCPQPLERNSSSFSESDYPIVTEVVAVYC